MATLDELWLRVQQRLISRGAHEVKGALNGVAVNLEVVRSRAEREGAPASDVARFANSAGDQLAALIRMTEAVLALGRAGRDPTDVATPAKHMVALLDPAARIEGGGVQLKLEGGTSGATSAPAVATRLILGSALLGAAEKGKTITCTLSAATPPTLTMAPASLDQISPEVRDGVQAVGIHLSTDGHGISIVFPPDTPPRDQNE